MQANTIAWTVEVIWLVASERMTHSSGPELARNCRLPRCSDFVRNRGVNWRSAGVTARTAL